MLRLDKTLRSLGQSTEADEMCDEVFKNTIPPTLTVTLRSTPKSKLILTLKSQNNLNNEVVIKT